MDDMSHGLLNAQLVFVSLSLFNKLKNPIMMAPSIISGIMECQLSYGRLHDLLSADEIDFTAIDHMPYNRASPSTSNNDILVKVEHGSFKWLSESAPLLTDINMQCKRNELVAVIGKVGSGKSSLISAILGDMVKETGKVCIQGRIAYVPQVPWIINATLRDNILFGSEMDQELYDRVIDACALRTDLHMLPAGDLTEIGEKGINLSGGQKARVSLARAVYSRADVYLMDDPLAAVDAHVGKHIFSHVLGPHGLLQSRARILATNATQYLKYTDNILMIQDGSATSAVRNLLLWARCSIESATTIHQNMLSGVMRSPMAYFDVTPVGRILNRFSSDLAHCDIALPYNVIQMVMTVVGISSAVFVISLSAPLVIVFLLLLSVFYLDLQHRYMFTSRETKRLESSTRSPIIAHLQESINGVSTIRAYGQQSRFIFKHEHKIEKHMRACYYNESLGQWLSIRLEAIGSIIMLGTTLSSVATLHYYGIGDPGMVGLAVTYALSLTGHLNMSVKSYTGMENSMVQLERINEFANLPSEAPETLSNRPAEEWPDQGTVEFKNYSTRYREGLDLAIKDLSFKVKPMQKVGIVGRTGAGKSSLTLALFRLIEAAAGQILIDGQDIAQYGLFDVRSKLSIIPQDPVLFAGTVRENLDPFGKYSDQEIWNALEHASLADFIRTKDERLEFQVSSGGENFSVGQRQLICLARALLKQAKILVLDEATAAIDNQTDAIIQKSIRSEFKQCTVLTIAHRINTIIDSDMILVLDGGRLAEYDTPEHLLQNKDGLFAKLVEESKK
ncbi:hypothetical protein LPJ68_000855 [Coemansia sp. RSA 1086]|nr:hypothetical protein LPJ68_000855 [Coemansia sp. RSA 1086]